MRWFDKFFRHNYLHNAPNVELYAHTCNWVLIRTAARRGYNATIQFIIILLFFFYRLLFNSLTITALFVPIYY